MRAHLVSLDSGVGDLSNDNLVAETNNQSVLRGVVFVLVLDDEPLSGVVVCLAFPSPSVFNLEPLEVGLVLYYLNETHGCTKFSLSNLK